MPDIYTLAERIELVIIYGETGREFKRTCQVFHERNGDRPLPSTSTVKRLIEKFRLTGSVGRKKYSQRERPSTGEENTINILACVAAVPVMSIPTRAQAAGMSYSSVQRILARNKLHGYKVKRVQGLYGNDFHNREVFCGWFMGQEQRDPDFAMSIMTSDEATFHLSGTINSQNCRYWSDANPHWIRADRRQIDPRLNVWCGIYKDRIIGPYFLPARLDGVRYLQHLHDVLEPFIDNLPLAEWLRFFFNKTELPFILLQL